jgi:hydrogenase-4 component B
MILPWPVNLAFGGLGIWFALAVFVPFQRRDTNLRVWSALIGIGGLCLALAMIGSPSLISAAIRVGLPFYLARVPIAFQMDNLTCWFLGVIGLVSAATSFYIPGYMNHLKGRVDMRIFWAAFAILLISMSLVVLASNVQTFLIAWELMSLSSFFLVALDHRKTEVREAALIYLGATRVGSAFLAGGFLWAHALTGSWAFLDWNLHGANALGPGLLILAGLGVKAGVWPFHLWLPIAHPAAPSPVSAIMSGVMVKVALYMMIRLFLLSNAFVHPVFGYLLLGFGAVSAVWGILFALIQQDLKRVLAYSTVENVGLILIGIGGAIAARDMGAKNAFILGCAASLFHTLNHALFKSLLFLGAGAIDSAAHTRDLGLLGGLGRRMPYTYALFVLGAAAICGLPPLNGFAGEWLLYQGSLGIGGFATTPVLRFCGMMMVGWISLIGALALACFVRAIGVAFQGRPRSEQADRAKEVDRGMLAAMGLLGSGCVLLGLGAPIVLGRLQNVIGNLASPGLPLTSFWTLPIGALFLVLAATVLVAASWMADAAKRIPVRTYITWECGFGTLTPRMQVAAASFSQPIARMFGIVFRYAVQRKIAGADRRLFPDEIHASPTTEAVLESRIYHPILRAINRISDWLTRLQAGSIHLYLLTMFMTLLALLTIGGYVK